MQRNAWRGLTRLGAVSTSDEFILDRILVEQAPSASGFITKKGDAHLECRSAVSAYGESERHCSTVVVLVEMQKGFWQRRRVWRSGALTLADKCYSRDWTFPLLNFSIQNRAQGAMMTTNPLRRRNRCFSPKYFSEILSSVRPG